MASAGTVTGRNGEFVVGVIRVTRTTKWDVNPKQATKSEWGDSDAAGFTNRAPGRKDATFTAEGKFATAVEVFDLFQPGDLAIAVLWLNGTLYWDFPSALNDDFSLVVDIDTEEVIAWTSAWGADGEYFFPGEAGATVRVLPS